jgi:hypothetical protein
MTSCLFVHFNNENLLFPYVSEQCILEGRSEIFEK